MRARYVAIALALASCSVRESGRDAGDAVRPDVGPVDAPPWDTGPVVLDDGGPCDGVLELGRCELVGGGACTGIPEEPAAFVPMEPGDPIQIVVGPQASSMIVLGARTRGIAAGDPTSPASRDNPVIELRITDASGAELAIYRGRAAFSPDPGDPGLLVQPRLFVVVEDVPARLPTAAVAHATLRDAAGVTRCGALVVSVIR